MGMPDPKKMKEYRRRYYLKNRELIIKKSLDYYYKNREEILAAAKYRDRSKK